MNRQLDHIEIHNFRSLADVRVETYDLNVLFGPNGSGKSTFLDTVWFIRDCAVRGVDEASSYRGHGIGALWDRAEKGANISIKLETDLAEYEVNFGYSSGRIEPFVGETLYSRELDRRLIERKIGSDQANFYRIDTEQEVSVELREPEKLALTRYLDLERSSPPAAYELDKLLRLAHFHHLREADLHALKKHGSESSHHTWLWERCQNLWSVLRNLHDRRGVDDRYDTILDFMRKSVPAFQDLLIEQTGPTTVYGNFIEKGRRQPIRASGVSDGHLQMLILLTALFSEGKDRPSLILFDEPEISLHPYALSIFAEAVKMAVEECGKQIFIATHSPVLISQFAPRNILAAEIGGFGQTIIRRVSEIERVQDLLEKYATGSLYMAEMIAPQSGIELEVKEPV